MPQVVYRSTHPDVLAHWNQQPDLYAAWNAKVKEFLAEVGFEGRDLAMEDHSLIGVAHPSGEAVPADWRRYRDLPTAIVPARRTAAGRRLGDRLRELKKPDPREGIPGGMPSYAFCATTPALMHPGIDLVAGAVVVTWSGELEAPKAERINSAVWERVPLSQYWAMREAAESGDAA